MGRRTVLLVVATVIALVGAGMVYLYVQGADDRAKVAQQPVTVLKAVAQIEPGETLLAASAAGKIEQRDVPAEQQLDGAMAEIGDGGDLVALTRIFPNEQITASKFGSPGEQENLTMPPGKFAVSAQLSDTGRVSGFISPGSRVAIFYTGEGFAGDVTRLLLPEVQVLAVGQTTVTNSTTTTTTAEGEAVTTENLPRTLITLAVDQREAEKLLYSAAHGELSFGLLGDKSKVAPGPGVTQQSLFQ